MSDNKRDPENTRDPEFAHFTGERAQSVQDALINRPRISIRLRIAAGFLVAFIFTCGITVAAMLFISNIAKRQGLLETASKFEFEIQQARRFEKNWFLYGTNLDDALNNIQNARTLLTESREEMRGLVGDKAFESMWNSLTRYNETLEKLVPLTGTTNPSTMEQRLELESELRRFGAEIVNDATNVFDRERQRIHSWLQTSMVIAVAALIVILVFVAVIASFITRQIIHPFRRFESYTHRIASGDFSLITPARKYRDEFTNLAIALNHMMIELKRHEDQLIQSRKLAAIGNLTAGIAHELNNPLNNISLTTEALIDEFDDWDREAKLKMLRTIADQVERAGATVANLLDFTRRDESSFEALSIDEVISRTLKLVANEISLHHIELVFQPGNNLPRVMGNAHNLQQVFLNLLLNAIQAMPEKGTLTVKSYIDNESVRADIIDTGVGIPSENLDKIFDPFFTTKEVGKGTGLGLSVSYGIVKKHRGHILVSSEVGRGTTFSVLLPVSGAAAATT